MKKKEFLFGVNAEFAILKGHKTVADAVGATFGANGKNVLIEYLYEGRSISKSTKDGVSVARDIVLVNPAENISANALIDVGMRMLDRVGDGTTTAILITEALVNILLKYNLKHKQIDKLKQYIDELSELFKSNSIKVADCPEVLEGIAHISSNGDKEITDVMKEAISHIDTQGEILVEVNQNLSTNVVPVKGVYIPYGFAAHEVIINQQRRHTAEYKDVFLILYDGVVESFTPMMDLIERVIVKSPHTPIVFIASHLSDDVMIGITANSFGKIRMAGISLDQDQKTMDDLFTDISAATGVPIFGEKYDKIFGTSHNGIKFTDKQCDIKKVSSIRLTKKSTIILPYPEKQEGLTAHVEDLNDQLLKTFDESDRAIIKKRIARLAPTMAIIRIGGLTTQTILEKKDRYEDAVCAVKQTMEHGAIPGGGLPLLMAMKYLWDKTNGLNDSDPAAEVIIRALFRVVIQLFKGTTWEMRNDRVDMEEYLHSFDYEREEIEKFINYVKNNSFYKPQDWNGIDLSTDEKVNLFTKKIFDPVTVITTALETGVEAAITMSKTGVIMTESRNIDKASLMSSMLSPAPQY